MEVAGIGEAADGVDHVMLQKQPKQMDGRLMGRSDTRTQREYLISLSCFGASDFKFIFYFYLKFIFCILLKFTYFYGLHTSVI